MYLKREVIEPMVGEGVFRFILIGENVLNFHGSEDCYYEEWYEDICDEDGWICVLSALPHVEEEMRDTQLHHYLHFGKPYNTLNWRPFAPRALYHLLDGLVNGRIKRLPMM